MLRDVEGGIRVRTVAFLGIQRVVTSSNEGAQEEKDHEGFLNPLGGHRKPGPTKVPPMAGRLWKNRLWKIQIF